MKWLFYTLLLSVLTSCVEFKQSEYIQKIDVCIKELSASKLKLNNSTFDSIPIVNSEIKAVKTKIRANIKNDTLPLEVALKIDEINQINNSLNNIENQIPIAAKDIDVVLSNLNKLKKDIKNGSGNRAKYDENIEIEVSKQTLIVKSVDTYYSTCSTAIKSFNDVKNELKSFSNELELKNKEQKLIP